METVNKAFSTQSPYFDSLDSDNPILQSMRLQVYQHVEKLIHPSSNILELNAGTGIDALRFISRGHRVHATDLADGMIQEITKKIIQHNLFDSLTVQQLSFDHLNEIKGRKFDYIFSNFGGLNCIQNLRHVTRHFPSLLNQNAYITLVIMPVVCPWEIIGAVRHGAKAFRRFKRQGSLAHIDGHYFTTYYHSLSDIKAAFNQDFKLCRVEGLAALIPQPHRADFPKKHPILYNVLRKADRFVRNSFPFNRWADHIIVTFQYKGADVR